MIIGACGFTGSGSSAITDYLKEFESMCVIDRPEFIISHSPDGLEDLDYQLNIHCCKYTASEVAIKRFKMNVKNYLIDKLKSKSKKEKIERLTDEYIDLISQVQWSGFGSADLQLLSNRFEKFFFKLGKSLILRMPAQLRIGWKWYPADRMYFSVKPDNFYDITKKYIKEILITLDADFNKTIVLNQPFSGVFPQQAFPFFEEPYAIIVDRDPRDQYVLAKKYYRQLGKVYQIPTDSVIDFVVYFRRMRECRDYKTNDNKNILNIKLEDMIYEYGLTTNVINEFCNLKNNDRSRKIFDPEMSINNTQVYKRFPELKRDIDYIEKMLPNYLYNFDKYGNLLLNGPMFFDCSPLNFK